MIKQMDSHQHWRLALGIRLLKFQFLIKWNPVFCKDCNRTSRKNQDLRAKNQRKSRQIKRSRPWYKNQDQIKTNQEIKTEWPPWCLLAINGKWHVPTSPHPDWCVKKYGIPWRLYTSSVGQKSKFQANFYEVVLRND